MDGRREITAKEINHGLLILREQLVGRLNEKGFHSWRSRHEVLGVVTEEYHEVIEAVKEKTHANVALEHELLDLAVAAIYGYINVKGGHTQW